jgi:protease PrsW
MLIRYIGAFALGLLPSIAWLIFFDREEEEHREPMSDTVLAFIVGSVTTFVALLLQLALVQYFNSANISINSVTGLSVFATIEEIVKFLGVFLVLSSHKALKEPLAAMIFMITAALGFAAVENIASLMSSGAATTLFDSVKSVEVVALRFLGATLLHCVTSGIVGFHWAIGWLRGGSRKGAFALHIIAGIVIASLMHIIFNYLILRYGPAGWALVFIVFIAFFLFIDFEELRTEEERDGLAQVV